VTEARDSDPRDGTTLEVRRTIKATPERLFAAWTDPAQLMAWWGPQGVDCIGAEVDLRTGGRYRIGNQMPDGSRIWIVGTFEIIDRPRLLTYSWLLEGTPSAVERVTVRFEQADGGTEVIVTHEKIPDERLRSQHVYGWAGCLDGLAAYLCADQEPR
jgi:uncharacterized protein YndB with AHSA1/START domain